MSISISYFNLLSTTITYLVIHCGSQQNFRVNFYLEINSSDFMFKKLL